MWIEAEERRGHPRPQAVTQRTHVTAVGDGGTEAERKSPARLLSGARGAECNTIRPRNRKSCLGETLNSRLGVWAYLAGIAENTEKTRTFRRQKF